MWDLIYTNIEIEPMHFIHMILYNKKYKKYLGEASITHNILNTLSFQNI